MATRAFKSISAQELEQAIASAISAITNTETKVTLTSWKEADFEPMASLSGDRYNLQLSLTVGKSYGQTSVPPGVKEKLGLGDDELDF